MKHYSELIELLRPQINMGPDPVTLHVDNAEEYGVYPNSIHTVKKAILFMVKGDGEDLLIVSNYDSGFAGWIKDGYVVCQLCKRNAATMRRICPFTKPVRVLGKERSFGVGDRLGIASEGHLAIFEKYDAYPVMAQQSIRELDLTNRTYEDVLDCVTWAAFKNDYRKGFGADGDHLKRAQDVKYALDLGYTMITLDCSEHIRNDVEALSDAQVAAQYTPNAQLEALYLGKKFDIGEGVVLEFGEEELMRDVLTYGEAIDFAVDIYNEFFVKGAADADFEMSIDETATPTTPLQHFFVASELIRRGVKPATIAPRFCGEFQKGVDYIGNLEQFDAEMQVHAVIARHFGYKISVHSGSDKFSVFPSVGKQTQGVFHVKTAGTNWLEAMKLVAMVDPSLYREIHAYALTAFHEATAYYHVTTDLNKVPALDTLTDAQLPELFNQNDARQLIHITYGLILNHKNPDGSFAFKDRLYKLWQQHRAEYNDLLMKHIGRHLDLLGVSKN